MDVHGIIGIALCVSVACAQAVQQQGVPAEIRSPWAVASGAEWLGDYPRFNPLLRAAGVRALRAFPEWEEIQPKPDVWDWTSADKMVAHARVNDMELIGGFWYFAPWASADGGTRKGPIKEMRDWQAYVKACVARYQNAIRYWEVWNEFNGSFYTSLTGTKAKDYAALAVSAYTAAKQVNPAAKIGLSVASFDVGFLDAAIKAGAKGHFDFVCVHPYENLSMIMAGEEASYLSLAGSLRTMFKANGLSETLPIWITETGVQTPIQPHAALDQQQAEALVKVYILSLAQGFERICWFEARGPAYDQGKDFGLIRKDWSVRPAYKALQQMTTLLGDTPRYLGWYRAGKHGFGFVFHGANEPVLVAWASTQGNEQIVVAGKPITLDRRPRMITSLDPAIVKSVHANVNRPFPWGTDFSKETEATLRLGAKNIEKGIRQIHAETTVVENGLTESWKRTDFSVGSEGRYVYFRMDPTFVGFNDSKLEITVVVRRAHPDKPANISYLLYESKGGYTSAPGDGFELAPGTAWQTHTWRVDDASFAGSWGWNFRTESTGSANEIAIKEVRVKKVR